MHLTCNRSLAFIPSVILGAVILLSPSDALAALDCTKHTDCDGYLTDEACDLHCSIHESDTCPREICQGGICSNEEYRCNAGGSECSENEDCDGYRVDGTSNSCEAYCIENGTTGTTKNCNVDEEGNGTCVDASCDECSGGGSDDGGAGPSCTVNSDCSGYMTDSACEDQCIADDITTCGRDTCLANFCTYGSYSCLEYDCRKTYSGTCSDTTSCATGYTAISGVVCNELYHACCLKDDDDDSSTPPSPGPAPSPGKAPPATCSVPLVCSPDVICSGSLKGACKTTSGCDGHPASTHCCCEIGAASSSSHSSGTSDSTVSAHSATSASTTTTTSSSSDASATSITPVLGWCCNGSTCSEQRMGSCTGTPYFSEKACNDYCAPSCERCGDGCTDDPFWAVCPEPTPSRIVTCEYAEGVCQDTATALRSTFCPPPEPACTATSVPYCSALALWVCWDTAIHGTLQDGSIPASYTSAPTPPTASPGTPTSHFPGISRFLASMLTATASVKCDSATVPDCSSKTPICCPQGRWTCWDQQTEPLPNCSSPDVSLSPSPTSSLPRTILFATIVVSIGYCFACRSEQKKL